MDRDARQLRYEVFQFILERCRHPTVQELVVPGSRDESQVTLQLRKLHDLHHLKLHDEGVPTPTPIAMVHPFSHLPTPYIVTKAGKLWWVNCAWCAFGLAAMLSPGEVNVKVLTPSQGELLTFEVVDGDITKVIGENGERSLQQYYAFFSAPPSKWWIDVRFACSGIQICTSEQEAQSFAQRHAFHHGDVISLDKLWKLSKAWYSNKAAYDYDRMTPQEVEKLFMDLGLTSLYWTS
ncbi:uncharacterized protein PV07_01970 [Cladophialophora immunda]|uniref:Alkylmercury lyase n=1 Tax=Cladophialophora immunda TaxID=569365 RepID=A0A0D2A4K8_9EURO|nr:uncharacterized protein PV07_01970 [Cladophialophora immunda]KIW35266.1 hypothetical protein PV07_01970 [Cladophialophora immunda]OQV03808.1 hypothetical protein CLAIMM_08803 isoform 1 [Cladophialophora immunda]OQV03809.1 hypothetical protein CLAIMM_08803 isoform 2 [Cladophialophora immunda]